MRDLEKDYRWLKDFQRNVYSRGMDLFKDENKPYLMAFHITAWRGWPETMEKLFALQDELNLIMRKPDNKGLVYSLRKEHKLRLEAEGSYFALLQLMERKKDEIDYLQKELSKLRTKEV